MRSSLLDIMDAQRYDLAQRTIVQPTPLRLQAQSLIHSVTEPTVPEDHGVSMGSSSTSTQASDATTSLILIDSSEPPPSPVEFGSGINPNEANQTDVFTVNQFTITRTAFGPSPPSPINCCLPFSRPSSPNLFSRPTSPISRPTSPFSRSTSPIPRTTTPVSRPSSPHPLSRPSSPTLPLPSFNLVVIPAKPSFVEEMQWQHEHIKLTGPVQVSIAQEVEVHEEPHAWAERMLGSSFACDSARTEVLRRRMLKPIGRVEVL